jgi:hypothetical protein
MIKYADRYYKALKELPYIHSNHFFYQINDDGTIYRITTVNNIIKRPYKLCDFESNIFRSMYKGVNGESI